jgi:hypothetical protein
MKAALSAGLREFSTNRDSECPVHSISRARIQKDRDASQSHKLSNIRYGFCIETMQRRAAPQ